MQIHVYNQADANFPEKISEVNIITLYDTVTCISCMSCSCYARLKDPPSFKMVSAMLVHSATITGLHKHPLQDLSCDWTHDGQMFSHQGTDIFIYLIDAVTNKTNLKTIINVQIPAYCIVTVPTRLTHKCIATTPCILEVEIDERVHIQNAELIVLPTVHLKDEVGSTQVPLTLIILIMMQCE